MVVPASSRRRSSASAPPRGAAEHDGHGRRGGVGGVGDEAGRARRAATTSIEARCSVKNPPVMRYWKRRWSGSWVRIVSSSVSPVASVTVRTSPATSQATTPGEPVVEQRRAGRRRPTRCRRGRRPRPRAARTPASADGPNAGVRSGRRGGGAEQAGQARPASPPPPVRPGGPGRCASGRAPPTTRRRRPRPARSAARPRAGASSSGANSVGELHPQRVADAGQLGQDQRLARAPACGPPARPRPCR